jgi:hypothetical protein
VRPVRSRQSSSPCPSRASPASGFDWSCSIRPRRRLQASACVLTRLSRCVLTMAWLLFPRFRDRCHRPADEARYHASV